MLTNKTLIAVIIVNSNVAIVRDSVFLAIAAIPDSVVHLSYRHGIRQTLNLLHQQCTLGQIQAAGGHDVMRQPMIPNDII